MRRVVLPTRYRAFTLLELLVVITAATLLIVAFLPSVSRARPLAQKAVSLDNLKRLGQAQLAYTNDFSDGFCNPFSTQVGFFLPSWADVSIPSLNGGGWWSFEDQGYASLMFSAHWTTLLINYIDNGNETSKLQYAPQDRTAYQRFESLTTLTASGGLAGNNLSSIIWDGSYWMSPTLWTNPAMYATAFRASISPSPGGTTGGNARWKRNRIDQVPWPQDKVVVWERFDFSKNTRLTWSAGTPSGRGSGFPMWNNSEAEPQVATADGSVVTVSIAALNNLIEQGQGQNPVSLEFQPAGNWDVPQTILGDFTAFTGYGLGGDGLENGSGNTGKFPAFFWATHNGVAGRDINR